MTLPPIGPYAPSPVPPDGFASAIRGARHRRWERAGLAAVLAVASVVGAGMIAAGTPGSSTVSVTGQGEIAPSAPPGAAAPAAPAPARPTREIPLAPPGRESPAAGVPSRTAAPVPVRPSGRLVASATRPRLDAPVDCRVATREWCGAVTAWQSGADVLVDVWLCFPVDLASRLSFPTELEADVSIGDAWQWSRGRTFRPAPHDVAGSSSECLHWQFRWERTVRGSFVVRGSVAADEVAGRVYSTTVTIR